LSRTSIGSISRLIRSIEVLTPWPHARRRAGARRCVFAAAIDQHVAVYALPSASSQLFLDCALVDDRQ
jgi:hypothetical protein